MDPRGTLGRSQNTGSTPLATSNLKRSTLRVSLSTFAKDNLAPTAFACASGLPAWARQRACRSLSPRTHRPPAIVQVAP